jgi:hypothetical protein
LEKFTEKFLVGGKWVMLGEMEVEKPIETEQMCLAYP